MLSYQSRSFEHKMLQTNYTKFKRRELLAMFTKYVWYEGWQKNCLTVLYMNQEPQFIQLDLNIIPLNSRASVHTDTHIRILYTGQYNKVCTKCFLIFALRYFLRTTVGITGVSRRSYLDVVHIHVQLKSLYRDI